MISLDLASLEKAAAQIVQTKSAGVCLWGSLEESPFAGTPYKGILTTLPLRSVHEFAVASDVEKASTVPVRISAAQRYALLTEILAAARANMPNLSVMLVRLCGPDFQVQLPAELLAKDVLLTYDPYAMVPRLSRAGRKGILTVWQDLRVDRVDIGMNRVSVAVHDADSVPGFLKFVSASRTILSLSNVELVAPDHGVGAPAKERRQ